MLLHGTDRHAETILRLSTTSRMIRERHFYLTFCRSAGRLNLGSDLYISKNRAVCCVAGGGKGG